MLDALHYHVGQINIEVVDFDKRYFEDPKSALVNNAVILSAFSESHFDSFVEFAKDNVENNPYVFDSISSTEFEKTGNEIRCVIDGEEARFGILCEYRLPDSGTTVYMCAPYLFIEENGVKYLYYPD